MMSPQILIVPAIRPKRSIGSSSIGTNLGYRFAALGNDDRPALLRHVVQQAQTFLTSPIRSIATRSNFFCSARSRWSLIDDVGAIDRPRGFARPRRNHR